MEVKYFEGYNVIWVFIRNHKGDMKIKHYKIAITLDISIVKKGHCKKVKK